jgi:hypothetical protein
MFLECDIFFWEIFNGRIIRFLEFQLLDSVGVNLEPREKNLASTLKRYGENPIPEYNKGCSNFIQP